MKRLFSGLVALLALGALAVPGVAAAKDKDRDGLPDRWERRHGLSTHHNSAGRDNDRDRVDNRNEYREHTDPRDRDTDNDRKRDGAEDADRDKLRNAAEDATGNDPVDPDTDNDGVSDGREHAGAISSFNPTSGRLVIDLSNGDVLEGWVTDETRVKCITEAAAEKEHGFKIKARGSNYDEDMPDEDWGEDSDDWPDEAEDWPDDDEGPEGDEVEHEGDEGKHGKYECSADWLDVGRRVRQAKLSLTEDGLVFDKIELVR
jgi:hypothetical protein